MISQYFPPDTGGASTRASNIVKSIEESGHEVVVVTAFPHYPQGEIPTQYRAKIMSAERMNKTRVIRVWVPPLPHEGMVYRFILYFSFALSALLALPFCRSTRVTWAISPNYLCMVPATVCKIMTRSKLIHDVVDIWPEALVATGFSIPKIAQSGTRILSFISYAFSDRITTISRSMGARLQRTVPGSVPVDVIENCVADTFFKVPPKQIGPRFHVMYLGTLGPSNDFPTVLDAARKLQEEKLARFTIAGSGEQAKEIALSIETGRISNVDFHNGAVPHQAVPEWLGTADALVLPLKRGFGDTSFPSKLGEYLASGRPVICMTDGQLGRVIRESEIGILVEPGSVAGLVKAIVWTLKNPSLSASFSSNAREYARKNLSYDVFSQKTNKILEVVEHGVNN